MKAIDEAVEHNLTLERACNTLDLTVRNVERWMEPKPFGPKKPRKPPCNALPPLDKEIIEKMIRSKEFADYSTRELSLALLEEKGIYASHMAFWEAQVLALCNGPRRSSRNPRGRGNRPDTSWVTGPNQLYSWDITHLQTGRPYEFWYLYALQDWFSRKVVAWVITDSLLSKPVQDLWDMALLNEGLLDVPQSKWPKSLSDRGTQMRSRSTRTFFMRLGVAQMFSRPRTPNDNPKIESLFSVVKSEPEFPGCFPTIDDAHAYFSDFFRWYNEGHAITTMGMLTPAQVHSGQASEILKVRNEAKASSLARRKAYHSAGVSETANAPLQAGRRALPLRFQYPLPSAEKEKSSSPDCAQNMRQLLTY